MATYPDASDVRLGITYGPNDNDFSGTLEVPSVLDVRSGVAYDSSGMQIGTCVVPFNYDVRYGIPVDNTSGTCEVPDPSNVFYGTPIDATFGTLTFPPGSFVDVSYALTYGIGGISETPTLDTSVPDGVWSAGSQIDSLVNYFSYLASDADWQTIVPFLSGNLGNVINGFDPFSGTSAANTYFGSYWEPNQNEVLSPADGASQYGPGGTISGTLTLPLESDVTLGTNYGRSGTDHTGTLDVPTPEALAAVVWTRVGRTLTG